MGVAARTNFDIDRSDLDVRDEPRSDQDRDLLSLLEALDVRIAAGLMGLKADACARDHLAQARELISRTLRRADLSALSLERDAQAVASASKELRSGGLPPRRARQVTEYVRVRLAERVSAARTGQHMEKVEGAVGQVDRLAVPQQHSRTRQEAVIAEPDLARCALLAGARSPCLAVNNRAAHPVGRRGVEPTLAATSRISSQDGIHGLDFSCPPTRVGAIAGACV